MSNNNRRKSGGGGRPGPNRGMRPKHNISNADKAMLVEGIYGNTRHVHTGTSIIGCDVRVEVKNGAVYKGIFKTFSPKMEVVLDLAHKVDGSSSLNTAGPSRDMLLETVIFQFADVVMLTAANVDMEYAGKDSFTDTAISSKLNGPTGEKQLQRWEEDASPSGGYLLENSSSTSSSDKTESNGWDPEEMFKRNSEQFNVKSNYDPSLSQYTTPLTVENTKEYKDRAARAARLAHEIESSEAYQSHVALENGDQDEEEKFSSVVRPGESSNKYVLPQRRPKGQGGISSRTNSQSSSGGGRGQNSPTPPTNNTTPQQSEKDLKVNGVEKVISDRAEWQGEVLNNKSESKETRAPGVVPDSKPHAPEAAHDDKVINDLKSFGHNFKLGEKVSGMDMTESSKETNNSIAQPANNMVAAPLSPQNIENNNTQESSVTKPEAKPVEDAKEDILKNSRLNPNAKVFNPNAKPFIPKQQPIPAPTPPRPHTQQSPVLMPSYMQGQPIIQSPYMIQQQMPAPQVPTGQTQRIKRATVSVGRPAPGPDFSTGVHPAMGQPLMTPNMQQHNQTQFTMPYMPQQASGNIQQMVHQIPMLSKVTQPGQQQMEQQPLHQQGQTVFVSSHAMGGHPGAGGQGAGGGGGGHMGHHHQANTQHSQQPSHMNSQGGGGGHAAPSPVQQPPPQPPQHMQHGGHPPSSVTPQQQQIFYNHMATPQQQGHPPLQASPHTPTSPVYSYTAPNYPYATQLNMQQQQQQQPPQMQAAAHGHHGAPLTTVTHAQHQQHQHVPHPPPHQQHPSIVVMPQVQPGGPHQQQLHIQGHHLQGPLPGQAGPPMMTQQTMVSTANVHHQIPYLTHQPHQLTQAHHGQPFHPNQ